MSRDPKPEILRIEELVTSVKTGDIKLPKFQRPFVWKRRDILTLWDSVYNGYPIGSILLWLTKEKLASERRIGDLEINQRPDEYPINYLLDGQQRLSSLCGGLYWDRRDHKSNWNIVFDLDKEVFLHPQDENSVEWFPLNKLLETFDFIGQCRLFENHPKSQKFERNAQKLLKSIKDYKIAAVQIGDMSLSEVGPVFERINSTGRQLTIVDLMRAATWSGEFDLNDAIDAVNESLARRHFENIPDSHVLRNISASAGFGINREDIDKLRGCSSSDLQTASTACTSSYELAVDFLIKEFPLTSYDYLPYALQLTLLVEFFRNNKNPSILKRKELKKWVWGSSFSRYFGSSNTGQNAEDVKLIREFADNQDSHSVREFRIDYTNFVRESFRLNKATSKSFALVLAHRHPKSLLDGNPIDTAQALSVVNRHEYHHIFPKAFLKSSGISDDNIDSHANICMLSFSNNRQISDTRPSIYFSNLKESLGDHLNEVLESNFMDTHALDAAIAEDFDKFLEIRSGLITDYMMRLANGDI